jgi:peptidoglycan/xylan/chitin deacetylase (PgdA/CDA1 family)
MFYPIKTPWWLKKLYPSLDWQPFSATERKVLYLTFDDGPHPEATPFVLEQLRKYAARGTFFCIGKNVQQYPKIYRQILEDGHRVGNHTQNHISGWKASDRNYLEDIRDAARYIDSDLFRPPYGRITRFQSALLQNAPLNYHIIMWDILSGDFDTSLSGAKCARNVISHARDRSLVVFHDSEKAFPRLKEALPAVLEHFCGLGYSLEAIR